MKKNLFILFLYTFLSIVLLCSLVLFICVFFLMTFPERFSISELDQITKDIGEETTFILLIISGVFMGVSFLINFILGPYIFIKNYNENSWFYFLLKKSKNYKYFCFVIIFLSSLISFLINIFYWINYFFIKRNNNCLDSTFIIGKYTRLSPFNIPYKSFFKKSIIISIITSLIIPVIPIAITFSKQKTIYINKNDINNFLTLSNNKENTLMLYFDRAQGMLWNSLLGYDYYLNKENSFISLFPEFTSFTNVVSQGRVTNSSNPSLVAGHFYSPWMNDIDVTNPYIANNNFSKLTMNQFWSDAFYNQFKMLIQNGVSDVHISSVPYYSYDGNEYGKPDLFSNSSNKINQENNNKINFSFTTNEAIAVDKLNHNKINRLANAIVLKNSSNLLNFINTNGGVFQGWYFHHTHEKYCYEENNHWVEGNNDYLEFIKSMWFTINELKKLLLKLKNIEWSNGTEISNVYNHTQILIVSDHGYSLPKQNDVIDNLLSWIHNQYSIKDDFNPYNVLLSYNSIFMYKPFNQAKNKNNFFDTNTFITSSDFPLIIEEGLNDYHSTNTSYFSPNLSYILNPWLKQYMEQIIVKNPLKNKNKLSNRVIRLEAADWRFSKSNKYKIIKTFDLDIRNKSFSQIFNSKIIYN